MSLIYIVTKVSFGFLIILCALCFNIRKGPFYEVKKNFSDKPSITNLFTAKHLAQYNGVNDDALYLAVLGEVYDVTKGSKHYIKGASYHYFVGKDGSRSLITGNFSETSENCDHVLDLTCDNIFALINWQNTFRQKYTLKGKLIGRYYDKKGLPTTYMRELQDKIEYCKLEMSRIDEKKQKYPPCNVEWSATDGTRVWCSKKSGGVTRNWTGVPRQLYTPGEDKHQCVCIDNSKDHSGALLKEYKNCQPTTTSCTIENK